MTEVTSEQQEMVYDVGQLEVRENHDGDYYQREIEKRSMVY